MWVVSPQTENISSRNEYTRLFSSNNFHVQNVRMREKNLLIQMAPEKELYSFLQQMISVLVLEPNLNKIFLPRYTQMFKSHSLTVRRK